jgi:hypothetical protein
MDSAGVLLRHLLRLELARLFLNEIDSDRFRPSFERSVKAGWDMKQLARGEAPYGGNRFWGLLGEASAKCRRPFLVLSRPR